MQVNKITLRAAYAILQNSYLLAYLRRKTKKFRKLLPAEFSKYLG